jgi:pre-mRNA-splicing factor ATP-dependent RNA helicase DHX16
MCGTLLLLLSLNITNLLEFDFLDPPPAETVTKSLELLYSLGALNDKGELTKVGRQLSTFPINPMLARSLLAAETYSCVDSVLSIISMLGEYGSLFFRPKDQKVAADHARARFTDKEGGDHLTLLRIWNEWVDSDYSIAFCKENFIQTRSMNQARNVREQLEKLCDQAGIDPSASGNSDSVSIRKAITAGYFPNAARLQRDGQSYQNLKSRTQAFIHPSSTLSQERPKWVIYYELQLTSKEYMRGVMPIDPAYLTEAAPHFYKPEDMEKFGVDKKVSKGKGKVGV